MFFIIYVMQIFVLNDHIVTIIMTVIIITVTAPVFITVVIVVIVTTVLPSSSSHHRHLLCAFDCDVDPGTRQGDRMFYFVFKSMTRLFQVPLARHVCIQREMTV